MYYARPYTAVPEKIRRFCSLRLPRNFNIQAQEFEILAFASTYTAHTHWVQQGNSDTTFRNTHRKSTYQHPPAFWLNDQYHLSANLKGNAYLPSLSFI